MNNQRGRRFQAAKELENENQKLLAEGKPIPDEKYINLQKITSLLIVINFNLLLKMLIYFQL